MFIGRHEVTQEVYLDGEDGITRVELHFDGQNDDGAPKQPAVMRKELFDAIKSETASVGDITDRVRHFFCSKILQELAEHELSCYMVGVVARGLEALIVNAQEAAISKKFNCGGYQGMKISDALDV